MRTESPWNIVTNKSIKLLWLNGNQKNDFRVNYAYFIYLYIIISTVRFSLEQWKQFLLLLWMKCDLVMFPHWVTHSVFWAFSEGTAKTFSDWSVRRSAVGSIFVESRWIAETCIASRQLEGAISSVMFGYLLYETRFFFSSCLIFQQEHCGPVCVWSLRNTHSLWEKIWVVLGLDKVAPHSFFHFFLFTFFGRWTFGD